MLLFSLTHFFEEELGLVGGRVFGMAPLLFSAVDGVVLLAFLSSVKLLLDGGDSSAVSFSDDPDGFILKWDYS